MDLEEILKISKDMNIEIKNSNSGKHYIKNKDSNEIELSANMLELITLKSLTRWTSYDNLFIDNKNKKKGSINMNRNKLFIYNLKQAYFFIREGVNPIGVDRHTSTKKFYFVFNREKIEELDLMKKWRTGNNNSIYVFRRNEYTENINNEEVVVIYNPFQAYFYIGQALNPLELIQLSNKKVAFIFNKKKSNPLFTKWLNQRNKMKSGQING